MKKIYRIDRSGNITEYPTLEIAMETAWSLACEQAEREGIDIVDLDEWGDCDESGWGVCPTNDDGAYWPQVSVYDERGRSVHDEYYMTEN